TLRKERWTQLHTEILQSSRSISRRFLMVAIDRSEAGIGLLSGSHLSVITTVESGASGKRGGKEASTEPFLRKVAGVVRAERREGDLIAVAGPGHTKLELANIIGSDKELGRNLTIIEGFDLAGADGIRSLIKHE